jgi:hypothetical protein
MFGIYDAGFLGSCDIAVAAMSLCFMVSTPLSLMRNDYRKSKHEALLDFATQLGFQLRRARGKTALWFAPLPLDLFGNQTMALRRQRQ